MLLDEGEHLGALCKLRVLGAALLECFVQLCQWWCVGCLKWVVGKDRMQDCACSSGTGQPQLLLSATTHASMYPPCVPPPLPLPTCVLPALRCRPGTLPAPPAPHPWPTAGSCPRACAAGRTGGTSGRGQRLFLLQHEAHSVAASRLSPQKYKGGRPPQALPAHNNTTSYQ